MSTIQHRHDISDRLWNEIESHLPGGTGKTGRPADNNRRFINGVLPHIRA